MSKGEREEHFWNWYRSAAVRFEWDTATKIERLTKALKDLDAHESEVRKFKHDADEQALADWTATAESYRDEFLMPLRFRQSPTGYCFVCFYRSEWEEFSPAEGGCYWMRRTPLACFPVSSFNGVGEYGHPADAAIDERTIWAAKEYGRKELGLTFDGDETERSDGSKRKVFGLRSSRPEADAEVMLEVFPFQSAALVTPHYE